LQQRDDARLLRAAIGPLRLRIASVAMILSLERRLALTPSVASLQTLTLRSSVRLRGVAPHHRSPTSAIEPAGQDLAAPLAPEINGQYRSNGARMPVLSG
jgi:hypothetical protein